MPKRPIPAFTVDCDNQARKLYEEIYTLALKGQKVELIQLSKSHGLNIRNGVLTPITQLAREGEDAAVNLLLSLGVPADDAVVGYCAAKNPNQQKIKSLKPYCLNSNCEVQGYVLGEHYPPLTRLLYNAPEARETAYWMAAAVNNLFLLSHFSKQKLNPLLLIKGAAMRGDLKPFEEAEATPEVLAAAIEGCIAGSHFSLAQKVADTFSVDVRKVVFLPAYSQSGSTKHIEEVCLDPNIRAYYLVKSAGHEQVKNMVASAKPQILQPLLIKIAEGYIDAGSFDNKQTILQLFKLLKPSLSEEMVKIVPSIPTGIFRAESDLKKLAMMATTMADVGPQFFSRVRSHALTVTTAPTITNVASLRAKL